MTTYRIIDKATGNEVMRYAAATRAETINGVSFPLSAYDHIELIDGAPEPDPVVSWRITKLAFRQRFSPAEKTTIEIASLDNPAAPMEQRALAASLRANQQDIQAATFIDLQRPDTIAGVRALETYGLIAPGRADQILTTPPTAGELWHGE